MNDIERLFGADAWQHPSLVAAAVALMNGVPRVVIASRVDLLGDVSLVAVVGPIDRAARLELLAQRSAAHAPLQFSEGPADQPPIVLDLTEDVGAGEILAARKKRIRFVHPGGNALIPGQRRPIRVGGATLGLPLLFGAAQLGALVELVPVPVDPTLIGAGALLLTTVRPARSGARIVLPAGEPPIVRPAPVSEDDNPAPSGPTGHLESQLSDLARRFTHRLGRDQGALATLRREAARLLQGEVAAGVIVNYVLAIERVGDGPDFSIECAVSLPKRVGKVIIKVSQT